MPPSETKTTFIMRSDTVNIEHYTIKDIPGSSGRLDVVARCMLAALMNQDRFAKSTQIILFFQRYGEFRFHTQDLNYSSFPKDELQLADALYQLIRNRNTPTYLKNNPMGLIERYDNSMMQYIKNIRQTKEHSIFVLKETTAKPQKSLETLKEIAEETNLLFVIGNQSEDFINSDTFLRLNLPELSLGTQAYLASSVIRLIKLTLLR